MTTFKKISFALCLSLLALTGFSQGWPANYGGVMLQGFYWGSYNDTKWEQLTSQADELGSLFDLIWIPNSGRTDATGTELSMGYIPMYWLDHTSCFGTEAQLRTMIEAYRQRGTGILMDLVINHKNGETTWVDFANETVTGPTSGRTFSVQWDNETHAQICHTDECNSHGYTTTGAADTGDDYDSARDLDHSNVTTQQNVRTYMDFLLNELGYSGFRIDMTKGYSPYYTSKYNHWLHPYFSVGEYWDSNPDLLHDWLEGTRWDNQIQSATFDYILKYRINDAFNGDSFNASALDDKGLCADVTYNRWAVTFVDNHDTGQVGNHSRMTNDNHIEAANALILVLPGTPNIFWKHYQSHKSAITKMIKGRRAAGITNQSPITEQKQSNGGYIIETQGSHGKAYLQLGNATSNGTPSGFQLVQSGIAYKYYISSGLDWANSEKGGGGVAPSVTATDIPTGNGITIFVKANDATSTHLYAWDNADTPIAKAWPGTAVRSLPFCYVAGAKWYYKTFDISAVNIIFNNGTGGSDNQTEDIRSITTSSFFTYSAPDYTEYQNVTAAINPYIGYIIPELAEPLAGHTYCYFENSEYAAPRIYTWDNEGTEWSGAWNGTKMTLVGTSPVTGNDVWLWDGGSMSPDGMPDNLVFNDGIDGGAQTEDMDFVNGGYYTLYGLLGTVEPQTIVIGDITGDGQVDISDVNAAINVMLGKDEQTPAADVTGDGQTDISDVNAVINIMLGKG